MNPLSKLILKRKAELNITWQEIARRGGFSSHSIVHALATKKEFRAAPRMETLERLAKALDLPLDNVKDAAVLAAGLHVGEVTATFNDADRLRRIAAMWEGWSEKDKDKFVRMMEAFDAEE